MSQTYTPPSEPEQKSAESVRILAAPFATRCTWRDEVHEIPWTKWHEANDPMPTEWDSDPPDEVVHTYTADQLQAYGEAKRREALEEAAKVCENTGPDDTTGENCAAAVRAIISKDQA